MCGRRVASGRSVATTPGRPVSACSPAGLSSHPGPLGVGPVKPCARAWPRGQGHPHFMSFLCWVHSLPPPVLVEVGKGFQRDYCNRDQRLQRQTVATLLGRQEICLHSAGSFEGNSEIFADEVCRNCGVIWRSEEGLFCNWPCVVRVKWWTLKLPHSAPLGKPLGPCRLFRPSHSGLTSHFALLSAVCTLERVWPEVC